MKRMVIKGSEWRRGGIVNERMHGPTMLLNEQGKRCCVGIHGRLLGIPDEELLNLGWPKTDGSVYDHMWNEQVEGDSIMSQDEVGAASINDNANITDEVRIDQLRPIFRRRGVIIVWRPDL